MSKTALRIERHLRRNEEPAIEDLIALVGEMRDMIVRPEWRAELEPPEETTSRIAAAASVDDFERTVLAEALEELAEDARAIANAHEEMLSDVVLDAYWRVQEACAKDPENAELAESEKKMRAILEKGLGGPVPTRAEHEAEKEWEGD